MRRVRRGGGEMESMASGVAGKGSAVVNCVTAATARTGTAGTMVDVLAAGISRVHFTCFEESC